MNSLDFLYQVEPYAGSNVGNVDGFELQHRDKEVEAKNLGDQKSLSMIQFEETIRSIYFYQQSYFRADKIATSVFTPIKYYS